MTDRRRIVAGNWKMHGSLVMARELAATLGPARRMNLAAAFRK